MMFSYVDDTAVYSKCDLASDLWQQLEQAHKLKSDLRGTVDWARKWLVDFSAGKSQLISFDQSNNYDAIDVKMKRSVLEEKLSCKMLGLCFSFKLKWDFYNVSIAKTASRNIGVLILSVKFRCPVFGFYLYKPTIQSCMEYCFHVWASTLSRYLDMLDKLQNRICRTVTPSLAASLESLALCQNATILSLFYRYYFIDVYLY